MRSFNGSKDERRESSFAIWSRCVDWVSGEHLLDRWANGGSIILLRTLRVSLPLWVMVIVLKQLIDPGRSWEFSFTELRLEVLATVPLFGAIFAGVYVALYARFASQWSYLANVYNQIKAAEARIEPGKHTDAQRVIGEWKAGFIEDAEHLHLATKRSVGPIILAWSTESEVRKAFSKTTTGGEKRLEDLLTKVRKADERQRRKYGLPTPDAQHTPSSSLAPQDSALQAAELLERVR